MGKRAKRQKGRHSNIWNLRGEYGNLTSQAAAKEISISPAYSIKMTSVHFMSTTDLWETPQELFDKLNEEFYFQIDVCALPENAKCKVFFTPEMDGLKQDWKGVCWMNPPYGKEIGKWVEKAHTEMIKHGSIIVCLLPARTDTRWWHDYVMRGEIRFIKGRLKFGGAKHSAPFPSAVVIFRPPLELKWLEYCISSRACLKAAR